MVDGDPESFMLGGTSAGVQANVLLTAGSAMGSEQVAQAFLQVGLEKLQGWTWHRLCGTSAPLLDCLHGEKDCLPLLQLMTVGPHPPIMHNRQEPGCLFLLIWPKKTWEGCY